MKTLAVLALIALTGCASHPNNLTFEQRMAVIQMMRPAPVYYHPYIAPVPQTHNYLCYANGNYVSCSGN